MEKNPRFRGYITSSEIGRKLFKIKAARGTHKAILAQGRKLCVEATAALQRNAAARRASLAAGRQASTLPPDSY